MVLALRIFARGFLKTKIFLFKKNTSVFYTVQLVEKICRGSAGEVWHARSLADATSYAVKIMSKTGPSMRVRRAKELFDILSSGCSNATR